MKADSKTILIGSLIVAILIVAAAYKFIYTADIEEAEKVESEIKTHQTRLNELNEKNAKRPMFEAGITDSKDIIKTVLSLYGPGNTPEKTIMLVVDMCNKIGIEVPNISFVNDSRVYQSQTVDENGTPEIQIFKGGMAIQINGGYTQIKKLMDYINSYPERMNVENFSEAFDANTGKLNVSMSVNMYSVKDEDHIYEAPVIEDIDLGTTNIFRTMEKAEEETLEGDENTGDNSAEVTPTDNTDTE